MAVPVGVQGVPLGEEVGLALSGTSVLEIESRTYRVSEGDSFAFVSALPHRFYNDTSTKPLSSGSTVEASRGDCDLAGKQVVDRVTVV
jgi:uncharacterized cupin superfamily protein